MRRAVIARVNHTGVEQASERGKVGVIGAWGVKVEPKAKPCTHCGATKEPSDFPDNGKCRDGKSSWCRGCHNQASREWRRRQRPQAQQAA